MRGVGDVAPSERCAALMWARQWSALRHLPSTPCAGCVVLFFGGGAARHLFAARARPTALAVVAEKYELNRAVCRGREVDQGERQEARRRKKRRTLALCSAPDVLKESNCSVGAVD